MENASTGTQNVDLAGPAARIAARAVAGRASAAEDEVQRLIAAGREAMARCGTRDRPRVVDIVRAAGLSNDAFYRHFGSKDDLVAAILEDGTQRLRAYLAHQMAKEPAPADQVHRWVDGVLAQAAAEAAATTHAVLWNGAGLGERGAQPRPSATEALGGLLVGPLTAIGSVRPDRDATLVAHAVIGRLSDHLWARTQATAEEVDHVVAFCLAAVTPSG